VLHRSDELTAAMPRRRMPDQQREQREDCENRTCAHHTPELNHQFSSLL